MKIDNGKEKEAEDGEKIQTDFPDSPPDDDIDSYMERLAREEYNYAYPDEARFYDASRN